jgi:hypothetical protein
MMTRSVAAWAVLLTTLSPMTASACWFSRSSCCVCCCYVTCYVVPVSRGIEPPARAGKLYAQPQAAPPSDSSEPPRARPGSSDAPPIMPKAGPGTSSSLKAGVTTTSTTGANGSEATYFDSYAVARLAGGKSGGGERYAVGFWNLSQRSLTLKAGGQARVLSAGQSVTMELNREFTWQVEGREIQTARVADGDAGLEIVIRR